MSPLPLADAARELGIRLGTLRRYARQGCPVAERGKRGRGHALLIDTERAREWLDAQGLMRVPDRLPTFAADIPGIVADATLTVLAAYSPQAHSGAEHRRLRDALRSLGDTIVIDLLARITDKIECSD